MCWKFFCEEFPLGGISGTALVFAAIVIALMVDCLHRGQRLTESGLNGISHISQSSLLPHG
jgi:hypothetical protein